MPFSWWRFASLPPTDNQSASTGSSCSAEYLMLLCTLPQGARGVGKLPLQCNKETSLNFTEFREEWT